MEVKPRNSTGLLLSIHGRRDFLVLELLENEVVANVENGKGPFHASYKLGSKFSLCDGEWHRIHGKHFLSVFLISFLSILFSRSPLFTFRITLLQK